jgi:hypothetical protein
MSDSIKIKRYQIFCSEENLPIVSSFFGSEKWSSTREKGHFIRKRTSMNFKLSRDGDNIYIDVWALGGFGEILPEKGSVYGMLNNQIVVRVQKELTDFLNSNDIGFRETTTTMIGKSQTSYWVTMTIVVIIGVILMFIIFPHR